MCGCKFTNVSLLQARQPWAARQNLAVTLSQWVHALWRVCAHMCLCPLRTEFVRQTI